VSLTVPPCSRQAHFKSHLSKHAVNNCSHGPVIPVSSLHDSTTNMSNLDYTIRDIHDTLKSYYKVARKRFADTVVMQGADHFLVMGPESPLKVFSPGFVADLTDEQLEAICGEDAFTRRKRKQLRKEIRDLEVGKKILV
jgi:hypothetical protein